MAWSVSGGDTAGQDEEKDRAKSVSRFRSGILPLLESHPLGTRPNEFAVDVYGDGQPRTCVVVPLRRRFFRSLALWVFALMSTT